MPDVDLPPSRHGGDLDRAPLGPRLRRASLRFAVAAVVVASTGITAGLFLGRTQPERAARVVVRELVVEEDAAPGELGPDPHTPTSGPARGTPVCGWRDDPLPAEVQVRTLAAGVVLIQHGPEAGADDVAPLRRLATHDRVAVAPNERLGDAVVATAWRHRFPADRVELDLLEAFVTGHADRSPAPAPCPPGG